MVNKVLLIGNLGDEVKLHYFEGGGCIGRFPIATSRIWTDKQTGEKKDKTTWHNIVVRNKVAENCDKYLSKGKKVFVEGSIDNRTYDNEAGHKVYVTEINASIIQFLSPQSENQGSGNSSQNNSSQPQNQAAPGNRHEHAGDQFLNSGNNNSDPDDDLPF